MKGLTFTSPKLLFKIKYNNIRFPQKSIWYIIQKEPHRCILGKPLGGTFLKNFSGGY